MVVAFWPRGRASIPADERQQWVDKLNAAVGNLPKLEALTKEASALSHPDFADCVGAIITEGGLGTGQVFTLG